MCGITGFIDWKARRSSSNTLSQMTETLTHRGPDDVGYYFKDMDDFSIGMAQKRLSIIDVSTGGHQPMVYDHLTIVFNGEIYNYLEIRADLLALGYSFSTCSDTEVILKAYHKWGEDCLSRFIGMWAFVIWNYEEHALFMSRDRVGVKPLFWYQDNGLFMFSSELKAFHRHPEFKKRINMMALGQYFQYGYIQGSDSIFQNTYKLAPGYTMLVNSNQSYSQNQYWNAKKYYEAPPIVGSEQEIIQHTKELLCSAVNYRMVADVPVGVFLSSGVDSSLVTSILQSSQSNKLKTFTIGFTDPNVDEAVQARKIAQYLGTDHHEYYATPDDAMKIIPLLPDIYDEPMGDTSAIPTYLVSQFARQHVKVALSADGGDELFAGYDIYTDHLNIHKKISKIPHIFRGSLARITSRLQPLLLNLDIYNIEGKTQKLIELLRAQGDIDQQFIVLNKYIYNAQLTQLNSQFKPTSFDSQSALSTNHLRRILYRSFMSYLPDDILCKVDRATMAVSLEGREPLLDQRLIEYVAQLPDNFKLRGSTTKWLLRRILEDYLPSHLLAKKKKGFGPPLLQWFSGQCETYIHQYLSDEKLNQHGLISKEYVKLLVTRFQKNRGNIHQLWLLIVFQMWYEKWMT